MRYTHGKHTEKHCQKIVYSSNEPLHLAHVAGHIGPPMKIKHTNSSTLRLKYTITDQTKMTNYLSNWRDDQMELFTVTFSR